MGVQELVRRMAGVGAVALAAVALGACGASDGGGGGSSSSGGDAGPETIKVLVPAPLSGDYAEEGQLMVSGAELAAEYLNEKGGVKEGPLKGAKFEIESVDDSLSTEGAATIASRFIQDDSFFALDGHDVTGLTAAAASVLQRADLPIIAGYSGGDPLTDEFDNVLPIVSRLAPMGVAATDFSNTLGAKRVGTIAVDASFIDSYYPGIKGELAANGQEWAAKLTFPADTTSFAPFVTNLKRANVDAVLVGADNQASAGRLVAQMRRAGLDVPFIDFVGIGWGETYIKAAGDAALGTYPIDASLVWGARSGRTTDPFYEEITTRYEKKEGRNMPSPALHMFDSILTIEKLISAGATKREDLLDHVTEISGDGLTGPIEFTDEPRPKVRYATVTKITNIDPEEREVAAVYANTRDESELISGD